MNVFQRIQEVRKTVSYLRKDKRVEGYLAVTHDQVTAETRQHLIDNGIIIVPSIVSSTTVDTGTTTAKGTPFIRYSGRYRFDVINVDEPSDRFSAEIESHALDHGDKAPGKALSYAKKAFILKLLEIETGEDEEGREAQYKAKAKNKDAEIKLNTAAKTVADDVWDSLPAQEQIRIQGLADQLRATLEMRGPEEAAVMLDSFNLDADATVALASRMDSKEKAAIKKVRKELRDRAAGAA